ncbi:MAG TPA: hypothetical protein VHQ65_03225 [Thermoanaerobaculia bacterium]|nr:hypothetical protein [Thermoanaerobaculia bacterium]
MPSSVAPPPSAAPAIGRRHAPRPDPSPGRRTRRAALVLLLAVAAAGFVAEVMRFERRLGARVGSPEGWRLDSPDAAGVGHFLSSVEPVMPPGSLVAFAPAVNLPGEEDFVTLWAAYHLPRQRVIGYGHYATGAADWLVGYRRTVDDPRFVLVERLPSGTLYRRR